MVGIGDNVWNPFWLSWLHPYKNNPARGQSSCSYISCQDSPSEPAIHVPATPLAIQMRGMQDREASPWWSPAWAKWFQSRQLSLARTLSLEWGASCPAIQAADEKDNLHLCQPHWADRRWVTTSPEVKVCFDWGQAAGTKDICMM